jgi:hypothetical protein
MRGAVATPTRETALSSPSEPAVHRLAGAAARAAHEPLNPEINRAIHSHLTPAMPHEGRP